MDDVLGFTYQPLTDPDSQTRVLVIFPDPPDAPLRIGIDVMNLGEKNTINYDALSYTWGEPNNDAEVEIRLKLEPEILRTQEDEASNSKDKKTSPQQSSQQTQETKGIQDPSRSEPLAIVENYFPMRRKLRISTNLETALRHLRQPDSAWCAWADGICINQEDDEEKSHQVRHMDLVYKGAKFFSSRCHDPRDIVYSLLSLLKDADRQRLLPNYSNGTSVEDVFVQCFKIIVDNSQSLNFIFRAKHSPSADLEGAETWLPCLGAHARKSCHCGTLGPKEGIYSSLPDAEDRASLSITPEYYIEKNGGSFTLVASGHLYCPIFYVGNGKIKLNEDQDFTEFLKTVDAKKEMEEFNKTMKEISPRVARLPLRTTEWSAFSNGPAQKGDIVCVLLGCSSPVVLRPFAPGIPEYYLISLGQVEEIMQGEFVDVCLKNSIPPQRFRIH
ncbi:Glycerol-3-phosphate/dihydroxyacetone phosphate acyltransferase [Botryosphaeria dothidea]